MSPRITDPAAHAIILRTLGPGVTAPIDQALVNIEQRPRMFAWRADGVEALVIHMVGVRQWLRGYADFDVMDTLQEFIAQLSGDAHPCGLVGLLRDHDMLGRGYLDAFGDLPRLLGDFARWVDVKWPAPSSWPSADLRRLAYLVSLGLPAEVVANGPAVVIAPGDTKGGRDNMPGEGVRADVLHMWRSVSRECGEPMAAPHEAKG